MPLVYVHKQTGELVVVSYVSVKRLYKFESSVYAPREYIWSAIGGDMMPTCLECLGEL